MKATLNLKEGMRFEAEVGGNSVQLDAKAPLGKGAGATPKELLVVALGGCTSMDVVALLKKHKQQVESLSVEVEATNADAGHPAVLSGATVTFSVRGQVDRTVLLDSVRMSQTMFCSVSAMLSKAFPIQYRVVLNEKLIGEGQAKFEN